MRSKRGNYLKPGVWLSLLISSVNDFSRSSNAQRKVSMDLEKQPNTFLRRERQLRGWSQQKVAGLVGTSEDVVSRWERGERKPGPFFQEKFCLLYGKTAEELGFIQPHLNQSSTLITQV